MPDALSGRSVDFIFALNYLRGLRAPDFPASIKKEKEARKS